MDAAEFDKFAEEYLAAHTDNLRISGEAPDYFARYKLDELHRLWSAKGWAAPRAVLDFGCGIGASLPHLKATFADAALTALDVSRKSLDIAAARFPGAAQMLHYDGRTAPLPDASQDLIFSACVFHHIDASEHVRLMRDLHRLLRPGGRLVIFEHNPINPVTRYIVATCPFDENAVLISAGELARRQKAAGFARIETRYTGFFPGPLRALRFVEPLLSPLPIGAQYYTVAHA